MGAARAGDGSRKPVKYQVRARFDNICSRTACLSLYTTAEIARGMLNTLDAKCRTRKPGDTRTLDQRRADTLAALVLKGDRKKASQAPDISAMVHVVVNIETLLGISDAPADLQGHGAINAVQARALGAGRHSVLRRMLVTPAGALVEVDARGYRLTAAERRHILARDRHCDFPGCRMPSRLCDADHEVPYAKGGRTDRHNMCPRCRQHHNLKTSGHFDCDHQDQAAIWTSNTTGRSYTNIPDPYWVVSDDDIREQTDPWPDEQAGE